MAKHVPADQPQPRALARGPEGPLAGVVGEMLPALHAEHELAAEVPVGLEGPDGLVGERHLTGAAVLRRVDPLGGEGLPHHQAPSHEIDVLPAQRQKLAVPQASA